MKRKTFIPVPPRINGPHIEVIRHGGDTDHDKSFCIFAVRVNGNKSTGKRKLNANYPYYLMQGFEIKDDFVFIKRTALQNMKDSIYNQMYNDQSSKVHINISAIVGMNGSGKSTLVEFMLRLINNYAASVFGEIKQSPSTERLHFIPGVDGELFYMHSGRPMVLRVKNNHVKLSLYVLDQESSNERYKAFKKSQYSLCDNNSSEEENEHNVFFTELGLECGLEDFFYTIVSNHSIYAYNTNDYSDEVDSNITETVAETLYEDSITRKKRNPNDIVEKEYSIDQRCWLHGLFHKNDGYQVPLVLTPYRTEGKIDINNENRLAKERLVALIVAPNSTFRKINDHLEIYGLTLTRNSSIYDFEHVKKMMNSRILTEKHYYNLREKIYYAWCSSIGMPKDCGKDKLYYEDTISYICYKTLKIAKTYREYQIYFDRMRRKRWENISNHVNELVRRLLVDNSHITSKLFQAIDYLAFDIYTDKVIASPINLSDINTLPSNENILEDNEPYFKRLYNCSKVKHIPSPLFDVEINIRDINDGNVVGFETLSSGEKQLTYAISSLLYHLNNIDSVSEDGNKIRTVYTHANLILEEIELYFHPELQKRFVKYLIEGLGQVRFMSLKAINIILVTHSPFVLSDIPSGNIIALQKDGHVTEGIKSFASNIHEMLRDSFFLSSGSIGDFAKFHIDSILKELQTKGLSKQDARKLHRRIMLIEEPIVRTMLLEEFRRVYKKSDKDMRRLELLKELEELGE